MSSIIRLMWALILAKEGAALGSAALRRGPFLIFWRSLGMRQKGVYIFLTSRMDLFVRNAYTFF